MSNKYTESSIVTETPREFTRRVPSTYLGSSKNNTNLIKEIFANAVDEHVIGNGNRIDIIVDTEKNEYVVKDYGQGFLVNAGIDENGKTILQRSFDTLNTSGKSQSDSIYNGTALGLNGIGAKLTNWLSTELEVITYRNSEYEQLFFKDGIFESRKLGKEKRESGTVVKWKPDPQFFKENIPDKLVLDKYFSSVSALCPSLEVHFTYNGKETVYLTKGGLNEYVSKLTKGTELFKNRFSSERENGVERLDLVLTYTKDYSDTVIPYVNFGMTESGTHITAIKSAFVRAVNKYATEKGLLKKKDKNFNINEINEGLFIIFNLKTTTAKYDAQNKSRIDDVDVTLINQVMTADFFVWLNNNAHDAKIIVERALDARRTREAIKQAKERVRGNKEKKKRFAPISDKLVESYPTSKKDKGLNELLLCEGLSALSSIKATRDSKNQAAYALKGKVINCLDIPMDKIYANQEVSEIIKTLGLDINEDGTLEYNENKLNYKTIILSTDAEK